MNSPLQLIAMHAMTKALFRTVAQALNFAFSIGEYPIISMTRFYTPEGWMRESTELTAHDWHAQGVMIRNRLEHLDRIELAYVFAQHCHGKPKHAGTRIMSNAVAANHSGERKSLARALTFRHFDHSNRKRSQADIAIEFELSQQTVSRVDRQVRDQLFRYEAIISEMLRQEFVSTGLCEEV